MTKLNNKELPASSHLLIGFFIFELGVECGPDLGLREGAVVHLKARGRLEESRELFTHNTVPLRCRRPGGRGGR